MNNNKILILILLTSLILGGAYVYKSKFNIDNKTPVSEADYPYITTKYVAPFISITGTEEATEDTQCPIPMEDRVKNYTGIQCVWSSIEMLGRWAEEPKLVNPPLTSRSDCKSYSGPGSAGAKLKELGVKYEQTYGDKKKGVEMIKKAMEEGRGCLFDIPGHAMVLIHYDEAADTVKWVNNSDYSLKVQTTTIEKFNRMWDGWVLVIYADNDIIPAKLGKMSRDIPIKDDKESNKEDYPKDFIPLPRKKDPMTL